MKTMKSGKIQLSIPAKFGYEKLAMETAVSLAALSGLPTSRFGDVRTAISEACLNAMEHGNKFAPGSVVKVQMGSQGGLLQFKIFDKGEGISRNVAKSDLQRKLLGLESARGWGIFLIEQLVDDVQYFKNKKGNVTQLSFHLPVNMD